MSAALALVSNQTTDDRLADLVPALIEAEKRVAALLVKIGNEARIYADERGEIVRPRIERLKQEFGNASVQVKG